MKVNILDIRSKANKDCMGSFGLGFDLGKNLFSRTAGLVKSIGVRIPDLQLAYLGAIHRKFGDDVKITALPVPADLYYIHTSINGYDEEIRIAESLSKSVHKTRIKFIGAMATAQPEMFCDHGEVIKGEPEKQFFEDINDYPHPDWELYDYRGFSYWPSLKVRPVVPMLTSRGCKFRCSYCPYSSYYGSWRPRKIENIYEELEYLEELGIKGIIFRDPLFTAERQDVVGKIRLLREYSFRWSCETRLECVDEDLLMMMKGAGCSAVHFGIESVEGEILDSVNRTPLDGARAKKTIDFCEKMGIRTNCFFIIGFPEDTYITIQKTIDFAKELNPNVAEFFVATPYPGTELERSVKRTTEWKHLTGYKLCFEHLNCTPSGIDLMREKAYSQFYRRPRLWLKNLKMFI